ncbi:MAG TPA: 50S ribosomal protein L31e [Candidatus Nanoarchaeia archaeon]|nr:50S ribosomal protein L31e [Candidatus Nanoarchaeia archaeon]
MAKKETKPKLERSYNIPLRKSFRLTARHKKTPRAVRAVREFLQKHMKAEPESIKLGAHLNDYLWKHGIKNPPHHVKVHVVKEVVDDEELVKAELEGFDYKEAVKAEKKKEPTTMKDKLMDKLGAKEGAEAEKEEEEKSPAGVEAH